eukprot:CAMPEP_0115239074 /NCGR_PEP_ID=MMETSP0270-20121206/37210_1 /TAXON_ID=71861 /ORGANISM="Scrippsiella trochoidea, Strain CCMP3099" /LENGTH=415 /DNA_ID=CAMNT_0002654019 /DNA_START=57 /DNA_END=1302 /DNA_ORIENTATION=-
MERAFTVDPAQVRVGVSLGAGDGGVTMAMMMSVMNELMTRMLNISRLLIIVAALVHQSCYMHSVNFFLWLFRLGAIGGCVAVASVLIAPEQLFQGMALGRWRWAFELLYPEAANWSGGSIMADGKAEEAGGPTSLRRRSLAGELDGARVRLRWQGTGKLLGLTREGWAAAGDEAFATTLLFEHIVAKGGEKVPDTYKLRVDDPSARWDGYWLSFSAMNQLRTGGWLGCYQDVDTAVPVQGSYRQLLPAWHVQAPWRMANDLTDHAALPHRFLLGRAAPSRTSFCWARSRSRCGILRVGPCPRAGGSTLWQDELPVEGEHAASRAARVDRDKCRRRAIANGVVYAGSPAQARVLHSQHTRGLAAHNRATFSLLRLLPRRRIAEKGGAVALLGDPRPLTRCAAGTLKPPRRLVLKAF